MNVKTTKEVVLELKKKSEFKYLQIEIVDNEENGIKEYFSRGKKQIIKVKCIGEKFTEMSYMPWLSFNCLIFCRPHSKKA